MTKHTKIIRVIVYFNLPFLLFLKDSIKEEDSEKEEELAEPYMVNLGELTILLRTKKIANEKNPIKIYMLVDGDKYGQSSYSRVSIEIDGKDIFDKMDYLDVATRAINHLIQHYRVITKTPYINVLTKTHIQNFTIVSVYDDGSINPSHQIRSGGISHGFGGSISGENDTKLRSAVSTTEIPDLFSLLDINIRNHADSEEWRLVVIESAVAYEAWIYKFLTKKFKKQGFTDEQINNKFINQKRHTPHSIDYISKNLIKDATGFDFESTNEYKDWKVKVKDIRNDIVHGKKFDISVDEAREAFQTIINCTTLLNTKLPS